MRPEGLLQGLALGAGVVVCAWYATRRWRFGKANLPRPPSSDHLVGLNYLINEQPDRAVEAFLRAVAVDRDTVETHFALGALFRRRGEVDRAIRVHQNLMARADLDESFRAQATYALAQDYLRAGVLDRAEKLLEALAAAGPYRMAALRDMLRVYEVQRDWDRAIAVHRELSRVAHAAQPQAAAHYMCELAEVAAGQGDYATARAALRDARREQRRFPRAALVRADVALAMGDAALAVRLLEDVLGREARLAPEIVPRLVKALRLDGRAPAFGPLVERLSAASPEVARELAHALVINDELDTREAQELARIYVQTEPAVAELVEALMPAGAVLDAAGLVRLSRALRRQALRTPRFRCGECGFSSSAFFWQCPGCKTWDSLRPLPPHDGPGLARAS
jgi:lipopolysaccharide biosynthesis regulator YciM